MKSNIVIFGDSYSELETDIAPSQFSWVAELHKQYRVNNFSVSGTGTEYSINEFNRYIRNNEDLSDTVCMFFLSESTRPLFGFWKQPADHMFFKYIIHNHSTDHLDKTRKKAFKQYRLNYELFCKQYAEHKYVNDYEKDITLGALTNVLAFSYLFKKVLIWPCFPLPILEIKKLNMSQYTNASFIERSLFELIGVQNLDYLVNDTRINHMNDFNNQIMFEELDKWLTSSYSVDVTRFKHEG